MDNDDRRRRSIAERIRALPIDLVVGLASVVLVDLLVLTPVGAGTVLRTLLGLPLVLFLPGYAFVAALFPETGQARDGSPPDDTRDTLPRRIDGPERLTLSVGASVAIAPLIGLVLNYTPWGLTLPSVTLSLSAFTALAASVGIVRRQALPEQERFALFERRHARTESATATVGTRTRTDLVLNIAVALAALIVISSVVYAVAAPRGGEAITEFYLLTENETSDELVADEYPTEFVRGEPKPLVVGIENHERRPVNYTVVVALQRIDDRNSSTTVVEQRRVGRFRVRVGANESRLRRHTVAPPMTGERLRLAYLLYRGSVPRNPTVENAYREVHLWVNVSATGTNRSSTTRSTLSTSGYALADSTTNSPIRV